MKKIILLIILIIIGLGILFYFQSSSNKSTIEEWEGNFAVEDVDKIKKIIITSKKGKYIKLERDNDDWIINDKFKADENKMDNLLSAVKEINIQSVPPATSLKFVEDFLISNGQEVTYLDKNDEIIKQYMIGPATPNGNGIYYLMSGSKQPFIMQHGQRYSDVSHMFRLEEQDYRDETVLDYQYEDIKNLSVRYFDNKAESFKINNQDGLSIKPLDSSIPEAPYKPNLSILKSYLLEFQGKSAEGINTGINYIDKIKKSKPFAEFLIETEKGEDQYLIVPYENVHAGEYAYEKGVKAKRYYVLTNTDIYTIQFDAFKEIFRGYSYFFIE